MTTIASDLRRTFRNLIVSGDADLVLAPFSAQDAAAILDAACEHRLKVQVRGGPTAGGSGYPFQPDLVLTTRRMNRIVDWRSDDLVAIVQAGVELGALESALSEAGQSAMLPEAMPEATVGGVVAAGASGWRRLRYGPTRDRVLEVVLATGDGRVVRGGAPVVKNVTGYDLPRLVTGSLGSLGVITQIALKLWPVGRASVTVPVDDAERALAVATRPLAVVEVDGAAFVYLSGTRAELDAEVAALGGEPVEGHQWPESPPGPIALSLRVPAALTRAAVERVPVGWRYRAGFGVGEIVMAGASMSAGAASELRSWAEAAGGALVVLRAAGSFAEEVDPWGTPPPSVELQRKVKAAFDPVGVCNPGILPGRI